MCVKPLDSSVESSMKYEIISRLINFGADFVFIVHLETKMFLPFLPFRVLEELGESAREPSHENLRRGKSSRLISTLHQSVIHHNSCGIDIDRARENMRSFLNETINVLAPFVSSPE